MSSLKEHGYKRIPQAISNPELETFRQEANRLASENQSACVHHIRDKSPLFHQLAKSSSLLSLIPQDLIPVRSILFNKTPEQNWPVAWHQDLTIAVQEEKELPRYAPWSFKDGSPHVQPPVELLQQMATIRIHLDDTPASNGALKVIPKSLLLGKLPSEKISNHTQSPEKICECSAGDILLMSPLILHASERSQTPQERRVLHFEYAPKDELHPDLEWFE